VIDVLASDLPARMLGDLAQRQELRFGVLMAVARADPSVEGGAVHRPILSWNACEHSCEFSGSDAKGFSE
jgi:hypothetical protein